MSGSEGSSAEEGSLCIDTQRSKNEQIKRKGPGRGGRGGRAGKKGKSYLPEPEGPPKPGDVVWAKVMGFTFWPAKVFDAAADDVVPDWLKQPPKSSYVLVRFFGTYDINKHDQHGVYSKLIQILHAVQWVSPNSVQTYARGLRKKFQSKSKSKNFQKAVSEVVAYIKDSVVPEGLILRPPYPLSDSEEEKEERKGEEEKRRRQRNNGHNKKLHPSPTSATTTNTATTTNNPDDTPQATSNRNSTNSSQFSGSSRRKSSTPRRLSSSSSESQPKRPRLESEDERDNQVLSPEVEAFTCAPLPLSVPSNKGAKKKSSPLGNEATVNLKEN